MQVRLGSISGKKTISAKSAQKLNFPSSLEIPSIEGRREIQKWSAVLCLVFAKCQNNARGEGKERGHELKERNKI